MNKKLETKQDDRGKLIEIFTFHEPAAGLILYSTTKPGITRGNHYHTRKKEYFCVIKCH